MIIQDPTGKSHKETVSAREERKISPRLNSKINRHLLRDESLEYVDPSPSMLPSGLDTLNDREPLFEHTLINTQTKLLTSYRTVEE